MSEYYCLARAKHRYLIVRIADLNIAFLDFNQNKDIILNSVFVDIINRNNKLKPFPKTWTNAKPSDYFNNRYSIGKQPKKVTLSSSTSAELYVVPIDIFMRECETNADLASLLVLYDIDVLYNIPIKLTADVYGMTPPNIWMKRNLPY